MYPASSKSLVLALILGFKCSLGLRYLIVRILNSCNSMAVETLIRTSSWNIFSVCGPASLGQKGGMLSPLEAGEGPWIQETVGEKKSWLLHLLYQNIILSQKEENITYQVLTVC